MRTRTALIDAARTTSLVMFLTGIGSVMGFIMTSERTAAMLAADIVALTNSQSVVLVIVDVATTPSPLEPGRIRAHWSIISCFRMPASVQLPDERATRAERDRISSFSSRLLLAPRWIATSTSGNR